MGDCRGAKPSALVGLRGLGARDEIGESGAAGQQRQRTGVHVDLDRLDRSDPIGIAAPTGETVGAGVGELVVPALREGSELLDDLG